MRTSISDVNDYRKVCQLAYEDNGVFDGFKNDDIYIEILEHTSPEQGKQYFEEIMKDNPKLLEPDSIGIFSHNDMLGNPNKSMYGNFINMSPSILRYIKTISDLLKLFGDLNGKDIVEIGIGYGGLCLLICKYFNVKSYTLIDLQEVLNLSSKYLDYFNLESKLNFYTQDELSDNQYDILISNYSFSECTKETQDLYIEKVLNKSKHGYMTNNNISHIFSINSYNKDELVNRIKKDTKLMEEKPLTHKENYILYW